MTRKYKQAAKRRNKRAVQKYRTLLNYTRPDVDAFDFVRGTHAPSLWQRITGWFKR